MVLEAEGKKLFLWAKLVFAGLVPLDLAISLATVHPIGMKLALHLGRTDCNATGAEIPVPERESKTVGCCD